MAVACIWPLAAKLGEGALWFENAFWFTDIKLKKIHRLDPATPPPIPAPPLAFT